MSHLLSHSLKAYEVTNTASDADNTVDIYIVINNLNISLPSTRMIQ